MAMATLRASDRKTFGLGLVGINMSMMPAFDDKGEARPERNMLCPKHKCRVKQHYRCSEKDHVVEDVIYGVKHPSKEDEYIIVDDSEWKALGASTSGVMEFKAWVPGPLDPMLCEQPYLVWPGNLNDQDSRTRFGLLFDLLERKGGWLLATTSGDHGTARMYALGIHPEHGILVAIKTRHMSNLRVQPIKHLKEVISGLAYPGEETRAMVDMVFDHLPTKYDYSNVTDTLAETQWAYVHARAAGLDPNMTPEAPAPSPPDLVEQLRKSIKLNKTTKPAKAKAPAKKKVKV